MGFPQLLQSAAASRAERAVGLHVGRRHSSCALLGCCRVGDPGGLTPACGTRAQSPRRLGSRARRWGSHAEQAAAVAGSCARPVGAEVGVAGGGGNVGRDGRVRSPVSEGLETGGGERPRSSSLLPPHVTGIPGWSLGAAVPARQANGRWRLCSLPRGLVGLHLPDQRKAEAGAGELIMTSWGPWS